MSDPIHARTLCSARRRNGSPCGNSPMHGTNVCRLHGGSAPQVRAKAAQRIAEAADKAAYAIVKLMQDPATPAPVKLAAARDLLDRNSMTGKQELSVDLKISKFDQIAADMEIVMDGENLPPAREAKWDQADYEDIVDADEVDEEPAAIAPPASRNVPEPRTATDEEWAEEQAYHRRNHTPARTDASDPAPPRRKVPRRRSGVPPRMQASGDAPRQPGPVQSKPGTVAPPEHPPVDQDPRAREADAPRKRPRVAARRQKR